jgi:hypothetical protein
LEAAEFAILSYAFKAHSTGHPTAEMIERVLNNKSHSDQSQRGQNKLTSRKFIKLLSKIMETVVGRLNEISIILTQRDEGVTFLLNLLQSSILCSDRLGYTISDFNDPRFIEASNSLYTWDYEIACRIRMTLLQLESITEQVTKMFSAIFGGNLPIFYTTTNTSFNSTCWTVKRNDAMREAESDVLFMNDIIKKLYN